jgi:hypothetical protein
MKMSRVCTKLADRVLDGLLDAVEQAEQMSLPPEAVLAAALETAVNLLEFERGIDTTAAVLEDLAALRRKREFFEFGWVLTRLRQYPRQPDSRK